MAKLPRDPNAPKIKRPQPGKNKTIRTQRRKAIAAKLIAQTPVQVIAKDVRLTRQMVNHEIRQSETQELIKGMMAQHVPAMSRLIPRALSAINKTLKPGNQPIDRLRAAKTLGYYMELAEGRKTDDPSTNRPPRFAGTMEELLVLFHRTTQAG